MGPQIGKLVEYVSNSGKVIYARIVRIGTGDGVNKIYSCETKYGNLLHLTRFEFRLVKTKAGSTEESFNTIFKG